MVWNQIFIQKFWFGEKSIEEVIETYGVKKGDDRYERMAKVLNKSKKDFLNGSAITFREGVDEQLQNLV